MSKYVDGFVLPVPRDNVEAYRKIADECARIWREHGALEYIECVADDVKPGEHTSFPQAVKLEPHETIIFAWIVFESREQRDQVNAKVMADPRMDGFGGPESMPFDGKRMIYGGFKSIVER
jgi:uncharacterized protein YbaA (DUF1428 family)